MCILCICLFIVKLPEYWCLNSLQADISKVTLIVHTFPEQLFIWGQITLFSPLHPPILLKGSDVLRIVWYSFSHISTAVFPKAGEVASVWDVASAPRPTSHTGPSLGSGRFFIAPRPSPHSSSGLRCWGLPSHVFTLLLTGQRKVAWLLCAFLKTIAVVQWSNVFYVQGVPPMGTNLFNFSSFVTFILNN